MTHVLVIDDDIPSREAMRGFLEGAGFDVTTAGGMDGRAILEGVRPACLVVSTTLAAGRATAIDLVREVRGADSRLGIVVVASGDLAEVETAISGLDVWAVVEKPHSLENLPAKVEKAVEYARMSEDCREKIVDGLEMQTMMFQRVKRETRRVQARIARRRPLEG